MLEKSIKSLVIEYNYTKITGKIILNKTIATHTFESINPLFSKIKRKDIYFHDIKAHYWVNDEGKVESRDYSQDEYKKVLFNTKKEVLNKQLMDQLLYFGYKAKKILYEYKKESSGVNRQEEYILVDIDNLCNFSDVNFLNNFMIFNSDIEDGTRLIASRKVKFPVRGWYEDVKVSSITIESINFSTEAKFLSD